MTGCAIPTPAPLPPIDEDTCTGFIHRASPGDRAEARALLRQARAEALRLRLPEAEQIAEIQRDQGWAEDASEGHEP